MLCLPLSTKGYHGLLMSAPPFLCSGASPRRHSAISVVLAMVRKWGLAGGGDESRYGGCVASQSGPGRCVDDCVHYGEPLSPAIGARLSDRSTPRLHARDKLPGIIVQNRETGNPHSWLPGQPAHQPEDAAWGLARQCAAGSRQRSQPGNTPTPTFARPEARDEVLFCRGLRFVARNAAAGSALG